MDQLLALMLLLSSFLNILHLWGFRFYNRFFQSVQNKWRTKMNATGTKAIEGCSLDELTGEEICMDEMMNIVMPRLGIACEETDHHVENLSMNASEFTEIFLDEEPSLLEIKQVFKVFDVNGDGFIDATELQRVLSGLSITEGSKLEECGRMISDFDGNGDGVLDFEEFVLVMEKCFC